VVYSLSLHDALPILLVGGTLAWLGWSESGLQYAAARLRATLPPGVELGAVSGRLIGPLRIEQITVTQPGFDLHGGPIELDWLPGDRKSTRLNSSHVK